MKIAVHDNRGNGQPIFDSLEQAGHDLVKDHGEVLLTDSDAYVEPYSTLCDAHERVFLHPHGAGFIGPWPRHPHTRGQFVTAAGQADVLKATDYDGKIEVMGWHLCQLLDFMPIKVEAWRPKVLLAPTHAMGNGWIDPWLPELNSRLHDWLAMMPVKLTVRYVHGWEPLGITRQDHVTYVQGSGMLADAIAALDEAEVVIGGAWTFPTLAVARGLPTIIYGAGVMDWRYANDVRFPLSADGCLGRFHLWELIKRACEGSAAVTAWRRRFIGEPWEPTSFVRAFERAAETW